MAAILTACGGQHAAVMPPQQTIVPDTFTRHRTFEFTGGSQVFIVPAGVHRIKVHAHGGDGASDHRHHRGGYRSRGGYGGRVDAIIPVKPGEQLLVYVGGNAAKAMGGFNGGGNGSGQNQPNGLGGGGASDVRAHGDSLSDRILVAGGGGGAGGDGVGFAERGYAKGGAGGGLVGGAGVAGGRDSDAAVGGGGGTQSAGGNGGAAESGCSYYAYGLPGNPGSLGAGGNGGSGGLRSYYGGGGGGGGGGGYYGGGAGGAGCILYSGYTESGGGGGGGSSYVEPSATNVRMWQGWKRTPQGLVVFDW